MASSPLNRNRDFTILWVGDTVSELGSGMSTLVFPLLAYTLTHSTTQAALATTAVFAGRTIARLPAGALVDRWSRRRVLVASNVERYVRWHMNDRLPIADSRSKRLQKFWKVFQSMQVVATVLPM